MIIGTVACIVQARMTSRRFPGKTMALLDGKPILEHVLSRAKRISGIDKVVCAFPEDEASLPILELCREMRVLAFSGDEDDVLGRYFEAAKDVQADVIMRLTADCPFIDPNLCSIVLDMLLQEELDYASNVHPKRTFPKGFDCEVFTFDCLEAANEGASELYDREHVTPWMQRNKSLDIGTLSNKTDESDTNYCVDFPEDIKTLENILKASNG